MTQINNFDELIIFIEKNDLTTKQIDDLVAKSIYSFFSKDFTDKKQMIIALKNYWEQWKNIKERPLFIDH